MASNVNVRNEITGLVATVPEHYLTHPVYGQYLVLVEEEPDCGCGGDEDEAAVEPDSAVPNEDEAVFMAPADEEN